MVERILRVNSLHLRDVTIEALQEEAVCEDAQYPMGKEYKFMSVYPKGMDGFFFDIDIDKYKKLTAEGHTYPGDLTAIINLAIQNNCSIVCVADNEDLIGELNRYD